MYLYVNEIVPHMKKYWDRSIARCIILLEDLRVLDILQGNEARDYSCLPFNFFLSTV